MTGCFFTTATHDAAAVADAKASAECMLGRDADAHIVVASPICSYAGGLDAGVHEMSLLTPLSDETLSGAIIVPPARGFQDAYGAAFVVHVHNAVRRGGRIAVPYHSEKVVERTGFWSLDWLQRQLGPAERIDDAQRMAVFTRSALLNAPPSVLSCFIRNAYGFARDALRAGASTPDVDLAPEADSGWTAQFENFFSWMNYSVTGVSYKTEGLRRLIGTYLRNRDDIRVFDIGGGAGFVDVELLLTCNRVSSVVNCEPDAENIPLERRLRRCFAQSLEGRYRVSLSLAQDYPFHEPYDVVCAFGSLFYIPRDRLAQMLDRAWNALRPGGILVIHENIKRPCFAATNYYDKMFTVESLEAELRRFNRIDYYRSSDLQPMRREQIKDLTVFRVVQKV